MANYFNTLLKDIAYNSYIQALFNYPYEWMNLFCCWCRNPKEFIQEIDYKYCTCDSFFLYVFQVLGIIILILIILAATILVALLSGLGGNKEEERKKENKCICF